VLTQLRVEQITVRENVSGDTALGVISGVCRDLEQIVDSVDNKSTRLYATGALQQIRGAEAVHLVNSVYVHRTLSEYGRSGT